MRRLLTDAAIKRIAPHRAKRLEIADAGMPGLRLVVQPSGTKSFCVRYRFAGKTRKLTLGAWPRIELKVARQRAKDALDALDLGRDPGIEQIAAKRRQHAPGLDPDAFGVQARLYISRHAVPHARTWKEIARNLGLRPDPDEPGKFIDIPDGLAARWAALPVHAITRRMVIEFIDEAVDRGAPIGANRQLGILQRFFNWLAARDVLKVAPTAGVKKPSVERSRDRVLSDAEIVELWKAADEMGFPFGPLVQMLLLTAQRRDEVAAASWKEFDLPAALWRLPASRVKNKKPHHVQLSGAMLRLLKGLPRFTGGDFLFGMAGKTPFSGYSRAKRNLDELAGIEAWTLHDLRRTAATNMASLGTPPHIIERILNHVSGTRGSVAGIYDRSALDAERRDALERWAKYIEKIVDPDQEVTP